MPGNLKFFIFYNALWHSCKVILHQFALCRSLQKCTSFSKSTKQTKCQFLTSMIHAFQKDFDINCQSSYVSYIYIHIEKKNIVLEDGFLRISVLEIYI
jgi:hypothetical protein